MNWFRKATRLLPPDEQLDAEIGDTIMHLQYLLREAETVGAQFKPAAKLARAMLKAINWL